MKFIQTTIHKIFENTHRQPAHASTGSITKKRSPTYTSNGASTNRDFYGSTNNCDIMFVTQGDDDLSYKSFATEAIPQSHRNQVDY